MKQNFINIFLNKISKGIEILWIIFSFIYLIYAIYLIIFNIYELANISTNIECLKKILGSILLIFVIIILNLKGINSFIRRNKSHKGKITKREINE